MNSLKQINKKLLVIALAVIFLISGSITTVLVFAQMLPDIQAGSADMAGGDWQPYAKEETVSLPEGGTVSIDLDAVQVELTAWDGDEIKMSFDGQLRPYRDGSLPEIVSSVSGTQYSVSMHNQGSVSIGFSGGPPIRGALTIQLPRELPLRLNVDLFSGSASLRDYAASGLSLSTSGGVIEVTNAQSEAGAALATFSGGIAVSGLTAQTLDLEASGGEITAEGVHTGNLTVSEFSGDVTIEQLTATGDVTITTSGGKVQMNDFKADALEITGFSGDAALSGGELAGKLYINTSSGNVSCDNVASDTAEITTFSGDVSLPDWKSGKLDAETSSGKIYAALQQAAAIEANTFSGDVEIAAPQDYQFTLGLTTFSGDFDVGYPIQLASGGNSDKEMHGTVGDGTNKITIETSSGDISVRPVG